MKQVENALNILPRTEEDYLKERVADQINWYDGKSIGNKRLLYRLRIAELLVASAIPILVVIKVIYGLNIDLMSAMAGAIVAIIAGLLGLKRYQENWITYRTVAEKLKYEKFLYLTRAGIYKDSSAPFQEFVERFENLIIESTVEWRAHHQKNEEVK